jgi:hypothetical protein
MAQTSLQKKFYQHAVFPYLLPSSEWQNRYFRFLASGGKIEPAAGTFLLRRHYISPGCRSKSLCEIHFAHYASLKHLFSLDFDPVP